MMLQSILLSTVFLFNSLALPTAQPPKKTKYKNNDFGIEVTFPAKFNEQAIVHELGSSIEVTSEYEGVKFILHCTKHTKKLRMEDAADLALVGVESFLKASGGKQLKLKSEDLDGVKGHSAVIKTEDAMWYYRSYVNKQVQYQIMVSIPDPDEADTLRDDFFNSLKIKA